MSPKRQEKQIPGALDSEEPQGGIPTCEQSEDQQWLCCRGGKIYSCLKNSSAPAIVLEGGTAGVISQLGADFLNPVSEKERRETEVLPNKDLSDEI